MGASLILEALRWLLLLFCGSLGLTFGGLLLWEIWTDVVRPALIPVAVIDKMADEIIARYPDPEEEALARHERAWYRSDGPEQVYWYRVRRAVRRRLRSSSG